MLAELADSDAPVGIAVTVGGETGPTVELVATPADRSSHPVAVIRTTGEHPEQGLVALKSGSEIS